MHRIQVIFSILYWNGNFLVKLIDDRLVGISSERLEEGGFVQFNLVLNVLREDWLRLWRAGRPF